MGKLVGNRQHASVTTNMMRKNKCLQSVECEAASPTQENLVYVH